MANYWIVSVVYDGDEQSTLSTLFATPYQADRFVDNLDYDRGPHSSYRYIPRLAKWREREAMMFNACVYQQPVWANERWWVEVERPMRDLFTHISLIDPDNVAFTEDEAKGEADRQTMMRPGKYLQKFLGAGPSGNIEYGPLIGQHPRVTKQQIAYYAAWHKTGARPASEDVLEFAETADEMVRVYENGPCSCMARKGWDERYHPVRVYAAGDLKLAYLTSASGEVVARALCWPEQSVFGRVYPTPNSVAERDTYDEMMARLKGLGWMSIEEDGGVFEGARLSVITNTYGEIIMPYLDHSYGVRREYRSGGDVFIMSEHEDHQENTDGTYCESRETWECENCNEDFYEDDDDSYTVYSGWRRTAAAGAASGRGYPTGEMLFCCSCRDGNTFYCDATEEHYDSNSTECLDVDGESIQIDWFNANGGWTCAHTEEHYLEKNVEPITLADGSTVHPDYLDDAAFECKADGLWWPVSEESITHPGYRVGCEPDDEDEDELESEEA